MSQLFEPPKPETEREYQSKLQRALTSQGWEWVFVRRMLSPKGVWMTGTSDAGWLDLTCIKGPWIAAIEVKSAKGKIAPAQLKWLNLWHEAGAFAWVLNPRDDRQMIVNWLAYPETAPTRYGW